MGKRNVGTKIVKRLRSFWRSLRDLIEEWIFLALLGCIMTIVSLVVDNIVDKFYELHVLMYDYASSFVCPIAASYAEWILFSVILITTSCAITHYVSPQAIGSGIPEMKTILRGVILKESLTLRTFVAKLVGLILSLSSGLPVGREGPFVHLAAIVAAQLSRLMRGSRDIFENESRTEMLSAGCAVGVASTFSSPIGGVLFSIEVTSVSFAVRNYWRGFFAAACSAILMRVLKTILKGSYSLNGTYQTYFPTTCFLPHELPAFALIGLYCGLLGALFIFLQRRLILFLRRNPLARVIFQHCWVVYPLLVSIAVSSITYPHAIGQFMIGKQKFALTVNNLFANCSWACAEAPNWCSPNITQNWDGSDHHSSVFIALCTFQAVFFIISLFTSTLPMPFGLFIAELILGATFGRTVGELVASAYPNGVTGDGTLVFPGVYAVVGAAAMVASFTHTISVAVIVFELTGQLHYLLPVLIAVIIANAVCSFLQPSIYDSLIRVKQLPYIPEIRHNASAFHSITVDHVMHTPVLFVARDSTYQDVHEILLALPNVRAFPIVDSVETKVLLGSVSRAALLKIMNKQVEQDLTSPTAKRTLIPTDLFHDTCLKPTRITMVSSLRDLLSVNVKESRIRSASLNEVAMRSVHSAIILPSDIIRSNSQRSVRRRLLKIEPNSASTHFAEDDHLKERIDFHALHVDSSPFHLPAHTTLFKAHSFFTLFDLTRAYVTHRGILVGVFALRELRSAIERIQTGILVPLNDNEDGYPCGGSDDVEDADDEEDMSDVLQPRVEVVSPCIDSADSLDLLDDINVSIRKDVILARRKNSIFVHSMIASN